MNDGRFELWRRWLLLVCVGIIAFGLALVLLGGVVFDVFNVLFYGEADAGGRFTQDGEDYVRFTYGVLGAVMAGWMIPMIAIINGPFKQGEASAWWTLTLSLGLWYVVDTAWSLYTGFAANAGLNTVFLVLFAIPLTATYDMVRSHTARDHSPT